jgi:hypothetical protein
MTFAAFYLELQRREGVVRPRDLIGPWPHARRGSIAAALTAAFDAAGMLGATVPGIAGSTPQSAGNKAAAFLKERLTAVRGYRLEVIRGAGYPDFVLRWDGGWCCAEVKSTAKPIGETSSLRIVLTGSSGRLRREVERIGPDEAPPCHLLFTLQHDPAGVIRGMRLDFVEPDTEVSVKFEASTSQQRLAEGRHQSYQHPSP